MTLLAHKKWNCMDTPCIDPRTSIYKQDERITLIHRDESKIYEVDDVPSLAGNPSSSPGSRYPPLGPAPLVRPLMILLSSIASVSSRPT